VGKPEGKRTVGRPRRRWEIIIKMDPREIEWGDTDWIRLAQDRNPWRTVCEDSNGPSRSVKCLGIIEQLSNWWFPEEDLTS
jgi:hypothetical protein